MSADLLTEVTRIAGDLYAGPHWLAAAAAAAAGLMRGFTGFGSAMVMAPVFAILFGPAQTIAMITGMEVLVTAQLLPGASRHADWPFVLCMAVPAALLMPVGLWFLQRVDADLIARIIGGIIVSFVVVLATGWRYRGSRRLPLTMAVGSLSGFMMAATSIGLPPVVLYMFSGMETATTHRANVIAFIALTMVALITVLAAGGLVTREVLLRAALLMLPYVLTIWVGTRLFSQSSEKLYRYIALTVLFIVGMTALLR